MQNLKSALKVYLENKFNPDLVFLYGSFVTNTYNAESDIDCICFANVKSFIHDSNSLNGYVLDCWVYPLDQINDTTLYTHIIPCEVLIDKNNQSESLLEEVFKKRKDSLLEMPSEEKEQLIKWITKMLQRSSQESIEGNYRYNWLLHDFPELYCKFHGEYYDGPIKTLKILKENKQIYEKYEIVMKSKNLDVLKELYSELID